jgi:phosphatidylserine/phosphatidylglycerophosphate/cardiolipin synthase-like enzyme
MSNTLFKKNILGLLLCAIGIAFGIGYTLGLDQTPEAISPAPMTPQHKDMPTAAKLYSPPEICFSPQQNCEGIIVKTIQQAQESIYVQAYSFTSQPIIQALQQAQDRHVNVQIILDGKTKAPNYLLESSLPIYIERMPGLAHNKVMIIDQKTVLTGSYNFTHAARHRNAENLIKIEDPTIARQYLENWQMHFKRAQEKLA